MLAFVHKKPLCFVFAAAVFLLTAPSALAYSRSAVTVNSYTLDRLGREPNVASQYSDEIEAQKPFYAAPRAAKKYSDLRASPPLPPLQKPKSGLQQKLYASSAFDNGRENAPMKSKFPPMARGMKPMASNNFIASIGNASYGASEPRARLTVTTPQPRAASVAGIIGQVTFAPDETELTSKSMTVVKKAGGDLKSDPRVRAELQSYASADQGGAASARRTALTRAIEVRDALIGMGVAGSRLGVKPLGTPTDNGPADRVDIVVSR